MFSSQLCVFHPFLLLRIIKSFHIPFSSQLRVFRPFFVSMHLPAAGVVRGEAVAVEMVVFNYGDQQVTAQVVLVNPNEDFLFADFANEIDQGCEYWEGKRGAQITHILF